MARRLDRQRIYKSNADRQRAYRERKKQELEFKLKQQELILAVTPVPGTDVTGDI